MLNKSLIWPARRLRGGLLGVLGIVPVVLSSQSTWDRYKVGTIRGILAQKPLSLSVREAKECVEAGVVGRLKEAIHAA